MRRMSGDEPTSSARQAKRGPARLARPGPTADTHPDGSLKKPLPKHVEERCRVTIDGFMNRPLPRWLRERKEMGWTPPTPDVRGPEG